MNFTINADSIPALDTYGWADYWTNEDWEKWVRDNVKKYGKSTASIKFKREWAKQDTFAHNYNWSKYDKFFVDFLKKVIDVDISNPLSSVAVGADKVFTKNNEAMNFIINADSVPALDTYGWADYWTNEDWEKWVRENVKKYGKTTASIKFKREWVKQDAFAHNYNWAKYDKFFVDFLKKVIDVDISNPLSSVAVGADKVVSGAGNLAGGIGDGASKTGKLLKYGVPIFIGLVMITIIYIIYKKMNA